jgi:hypothetical protein
MHLAAPETDLLNRPSGMLLGRERLLQARTSHHNQLLRKDHGKFFPGGKKVCHTHVKVPLKK